MAEINFIKHAMNLLTDAMNEDPEYRDGWRANIAMTIYDSVTAEPYNIGTEENPQWINEPLDPTNGEHCNAIAERFLRLAFPPKDPTDI